MYNYVTVLELCLRKWKGEERKNLNFCLFFSAFAWSSRTLGAFYSRIVKALSVSILSYFAVVIRELLPYLKYMEQF